MNRLRSSASRPFRPARLLALLCCVGAITGCRIEPDPDFPPPLSPKSPEARTRVVVAPVENAAPSTEVAQWTFSTRRVLVELLRKSKNFEVVEAGTAGTAGTIFLRFTDVRDEPWLETVTFGAEQSVNRQRRAVVEMDFRFVAGSGAHTAGERLLADALREGEEPIPIPTQDQLESGSFWESPYGSATRENLDLLVRRLVERG